MFFKLFSLAVYKYWSANFEFCLDHRLDLSEPDCRSHNDGLVLMSLWAQRSTASTSSRISISNPQLAFFLFSHLFISTCWPFDILVSHGKKIAFARFIFSASINWTYCNNYNFNYNDNDDNYYYNNTPLASQFLLSPSWRKIADA